MTNEPAEQQGEWRWINGVELQAPTGEKWDTRFTGRFDEQRRQLLSFLNAKERRITALETENARLREALEALYGVQNGPPLVKYEDDWNDAMDKAASLLRLSSTGGEA